MTSAPEDPMQKDSKNSYDTVKIVSWNVNGLQGILKKDALGTPSTITQLRKAEKPSALRSMITAELPDILCLQEIRCSEAFDHTIHFPEYSHQFANWCTRRKGYSGTMVLSKITPEVVHYNFEEFAETPSDPYIVDEGRVLTLYFREFVLVNVYVPNSGVDGLARLKYRTETWEPLMRRYLSSLIEKYHNVVIIGDFNVISESHDVNLHSDILSDDTTFAGATPSERHEWRRLLELGLHDTYRIHTPLTTLAITWYCKNSYNRAVRGCRLDYALVTDKLRSRVISSTILAQYPGSDHYPIHLTLSNR